LIFILFLAFVEPYFGEKNLFNKKVLRAGLHVSPMGSSVLTEVIRQNRLHQLYCQSSVSKKKDFIFHQYRWTNPLVEIGQSLGTQYMWNSYCIHPHPVIYYILILCPYKSAIATWTYSTPSKASPPTDTCKRGL